MKIPVTNEIGVYKTPKATREIWKLGSFTPNALLSSALPISKPRIYKTTAV